MTFSWRRADANSGAERVFFGTWPRVRPTDSQKPHRKFACGDRRRRRRTERSPSHNQQVNFATCTAAGRSPILSAATQSALIGVRSPIKKPQHVNQIYKQKNDGHLKGAWPSEVSWWPTYVDELHGDRRCTHWSIAPKVALDRPNFLPEKGRGRRRRFFSISTSVEGTLGPGALSMARAALGRSARGLAGGRGTHTHSRTHNCSPGCPVTRVVANESSGRNVSTQHCTIRVRCELQTTTDQTSFSLPLHLWWFRRLVCETSIGGSSADGHVHARCRKHSRWRYYRNSFTKSTNLKNEIRATWNKYRGEQARMEFYSEKKTRTKFILVFASKITLKLL